MRCLPFVLLALMVFAWGTGYKLSLYKAAPKDGTTPAKLARGTANGAERPSRRSEKPGTLALVALGRCSSREPWRLPICTPVAWRMVNP